MPKFFFAALAFFLICADLHAQNTVKFDLEVPAAKVKNSYYNKLTLLDLRPDTTNLGIAQTGAFNRKAKVLAKPSLCIQLNSLMDSIVISSERKGVLLLQLRQFSFAEITGSFSEKGYIYLRAELYVNQSGQYQNINTIDTAVLLSSSLDVTKPMLRAGSQLLAGFILNNLLHEATGSTLSYSDILNIDNIEKSRLKLYSTATYTDGLYATYQSFANQIPDKQITVDEGDITPDAVKAPDANGKLKKVPSQSIYAIVYKGQPYIASKSDYYLLTKNNNDFFFTGSGKVTASAANVITAGVFFGMLGTLIASNAEAMFEMKVDHKGGGFIRLKEIPQKPSADYSNY